MMLRATTLTTLILCGLLATLIVAADKLDSPGRVSETLPPDSANEHPGSRSDARQIAHEISRIRDELNLNVLGGTSLDSSDPASGSGMSADFFESKLNQLADKQIVEGQAADSPGNASTAGQRMQQRRARRLGNPYDVGAPTSDAWADSQSVLLHTLIDASARIDQIANKLEHRRLYGDADCLRGIAQEIRVTVRSVDPAE